MMNILGQGGVEILQDGRRAADVSNPKGYFEFTPVKSLARDNAWLERAEGKAVKVISELLRHLPDGFHYKVLFMRRNLDEVLASQDAMLRTLGTASDDDAAPREALKKTLKKTMIAHLGEVEALLQGNPRFETLYVSYNRLVGGEKPNPEIARVASFLAHGSATTLELDVARMHDAIDPSLYRNRH